MRGLRIAVPSAAALLTDSAPHGEGLIGWSLLQGLAARGHELVVWTREAKLESAPPFELVELGRTSVRESLEPLAYARATRREIERLGGRRRFDVAWWLYPGEPDNLFVPPRGLPLVVGPVLALWPGGYKRPFRAGDLLRAAATPLYARARRAMSSATSTLLLATPDACGTPMPAGARVVPIGIDRRRFQASAPANAERVAFVGRLDEEKGVRELVEAFALVRAARPRASLVLAGDGPQRGWIESRARELGLNGSLTLLGAVGREAVGDVIADSSLVCVPSHGEPYGMAVLEAMACGRAVVATDAGGPRFLVDRSQGGRLVAPGDVPALAAALAELLADPAELARMGSFNRRRVEAELGLEQTVDAIEAALAEAASR